MRYLNLGCGHRFHSQWTNVDFRSAAKEVISHDLSQGIPFSNNSFDVVYHSHVLEHFSKVQAKFFLKECYRVLRPQGILRVVVPDLEQIARLYLETLENTNHSSHFKDNYEWILIELLDQIVRTSSGGEMVSYVSNENIPNFEFVLSRLGSEVSYLVEFGREQYKFQVNKKNSKSKLKSIYHFLRYSKFRKEVLLQFILGREYEALRIGRFRQSGEVHQWMYDRFSLATLFKELSLKSIVRRTASESYIPSWIEFNLDTEPDGTVYKPDSLFMEAIKS